MVVLDRKRWDGKQINALSNMGIVATFIGMTTDSRSFYLIPDMSILEE
jgi:glucuronate isomerase